MSLILHGRTTSSNVQMVLWAIHELGLGVDRRDVGGRFGGTDTPSFRAMNPMGIVPVLQDGALTLFESCAILRYLLAHHGPGPFGNHPLCDVWAEWAKQNAVRAFVLPVFWAFYRVPQEARDMMAVVDALRAYEALAAVAMVQRGRHGWLVGDQISLADVVFGHVLFRYSTLDLPRRAPEGLEAYYDALCDRAAFQKAVMTDYSELQGRIAF